jgi:FkbM family methyltransferase
VQYFDEDVVRLSEHEIFVDCGAYDGDSVRSFLKYAHGKYDGIFAYEMDETNYKKLRENCAELERCECVNSGIGARKEQLKAFVGENASSHIAEEGNGTIQIDRIDDLVSYPVTFIKMDIEGYELDALKGARETICKYKPKLAICMYHKPEDLWEIPAFIKHLNPDYKLYFRNYHNSGSESVLYAL